MPESDNLPAKRLSDAEVLRHLKKYLLLRKDRVPFHKAARQVGLPVSTIRSYRADNPQFLDAEKDAVSEGIEAYEEKLDTLAIGGDYQALVKLLEANDPDKWDKKSTGNRAGTVVVVVDAANYLDRVLKLREELERRQRDIPHHVMERNPFLQDFESAPVDVHETSDEITDAELL